MGLRIPEDVALVGFNDVRITSFCTVQMTTVSQHSYEMGRLGAERLIEKLEKREGLKKNYRVVLEPELVVRKSCGFSQLPGYKRKKRERAGEVHRLYKRLYPEKRDCNLRAKKHA
jgi:hypothetical protein